MAEEKTIIEEVKVPEDSAILEDKEDEESKDSEEITEQTEEETTNEDQKDDSEGEDTSGDKWYSELKAKLNLTDANETEVDDNTVEYLTDDYTDVATAVVSDIDIDVESYEDGALKASYNGLIINITKEDKKTKIVLSNGEPEKSTEETSEEEPTEPETTDESTEEAPASDEPEFESISLGDFADEIELESPTSMKV